MPVEERDLGFGWVRRIARTGLSSLLLLMPIVMKRCEIVLCGLVIAMVNRFLLMTIAAVMPAMSFAQSITRFEQDNLNIIYAGTWYSNSSVEESSGTSTMTNRKGSQVNVYFNGTGISWFGLSDG
jgi:hypothetical protein